MIDPITQSFDDGVSKLQGQLQKGIITQQQYERAFNALAASFDFVDDKPLRKWTKEDKIWTGKITPHHITMSK